MRPCTRLPLRAALPLLSCLLLLPPPPAAAAASAGEPPPGTVTLAFENAGIEGVARTLGLISHRNVVVDPRVKGTLSLATDTPVAPARAWQLFLAALRLQGFAVVEGAGLYRIVPEADAKLMAGEVQIEAARGAPGAGAGEQIVTAVLRLDHASAANLVPVLRPLISPNNVINVDSGSNALVITDYAGNLQRLRGIVAALDQPSATDVEVLPLRWGSAQEIAATVRRLAPTAALAGAAAAGGGGGAAGASAAGAEAAAGSGAGTATAGLVVVADTQGNNLLVRAPSRAQLAAVRALVARLDRPRDEANVRVVYLRNAQATRIAQVLRAAFPADAAGSGGTGTGAASGGTGGSSTGASATGLSGLSSGGTSAGSSGSTSSSTGKTSSASSTAVSAIAAPTTGGGIQADPASNALVITAPEPKFREMREIIEQLDTRRAQLYVESLVVEVDASKSVDLGLQWASIPDISSSTSLTLGTVAKALETISGTNILSTANVVTLDNEEARIVVGQNVPYITGSYTSSTNANPFQTVERKDVGITLRIRPQIGQDGNIRMAIYQESSSVASTSSTLGPTTNQRAIESTVTVNNGRIIVLGGLIEDRYADEANNVPWVSELPLLGGIFRSIGRSHKKTNLLVFLRPVVMPDEAAATALSLDRYDYIGARQDELAGGVRRLPRDFMAEPVRVAPLPRTTP